MYRDTSLIQFGKQTTLVDLLRYKVIEQPNQIAYTIEKWIIIYLNFIDIFYYLNLGNNGFKKIRISGLGFPTKKPLKSIFLEIVAVFSQIVYIPKKDSNSLYNYRRNTSYILTLVYIARAFSQTSILSEY